MRWVLNRVLRCLLGSATVLAVVACSASGGGGSRTPRAVLEPARHFLGAYVAEDGRVLRHDQGDDVVSEGQAYGMLIAELGGRDDVVRTIWTWTKSHLQRSDALLSYHADGGGAVLDPAPAADADILAAFALLRYKGPGSDLMHRDGRRIADAVLTHESVRTESGGLVPAAGTWAVGPPAVVNPSYWMPGVARDLADLTGDSRWRTMATTMIKLLGDLTDNGATLPPDWARLSGSAIEAAGAPDGSRPAQYGPDAQRVPLFFAAGCSRQAAYLAGAWWKILGREDRASALALRTDGSVVDATRSPLALLAAAATARAAGDDDRGSQLSRQATGQAKSTPTYYGDAWVALAAGLRDGALTRC